jgi:hypothetical protein
MVPPDTPSRFLVTRITVVDFAIGYPGRVLENTLPLRQPLLFIEPWRLNDSD